MPVASKISDPIALAIFQSSMHSIAEEMGAALRRTSISPNIMERRDYSCAVFDAQRRVIAMGDHMPVHLGSMPMSVKAAVDALTLERGDVVILNDPYAGGTHLPDITLVLPVFVDHLPDPVFYVAARAHHADVGGTFAGSMGPGREIFQEGIRIPPIRIVRGGKIDQEVLSLILHNVRTPVEREGDLVAQIGACKVGERRLLEVLQKYGLDVISALTEELLDYSDRLMRSELRKLPAGTFTAEDFLDDDGVSDGPIRIAVSMRIEPSPGHGAHRLCRFRPAGGGQRQCCLRHHVLGVLLRSALPAGGGCAGNRGPDVCSHGACSGGHDRERAHARRGRRRQCGGVATHRRRAAARPGTGRSGKGAGRELWHHEQSDHRRF